MKMKKIGQSSKKWAKVSFSDPQNRPILRSNVLIDVHFDPSKLAKSLKNTVRKPLRSSICEKNRIFCLCGQKKTKSVKPPKKNDTLS